MYTVMCCIVDFLYLLLISYIELGCVFRHPATHNARHRIKKSVFRQPFVELVNPAIVIGKYMRAYLKIAIPL